MSYYYDTCIFMHSLNPNSAEFRQCEFITDASKIYWEIVISSEISVSEAPIGELLDQFEADCARNGVRLVNATIAEARQAARQYQAEKNALRQKGFSGHDWNHLCAAVSAGSQEIVTADDDFFDPANKRTPNARKKSTVVKDYIENSFAISVLRPDECPR